MLGGDPFRRSQAMPMSLLPTVQRFAEPFPYVHATKALPSPWADHLLALFEAPQAWQHHRSFYRAAIAVVSDQVPRAWRQQMARRAAELFELPLVDDCRITIQTMTEGQGSDVHSDRPLAGYEVARWVWQLNEDWSPAHGGVLGIHGPDGGRVRSHEPVWNSLFGFVMYPESVHSVSEVHALRRTVVVHFFHPANSEAMATHLSRLMGAMDFSTWPTALWDRADVAEQVHPDEQTFAAGAVAWLLHHWGRPLEEVIDAYDAVAPVPRDDAWFDALVQEDLTPSTLLAIWAVHLHLDHFDPRSWRRLKRRIPGNEQMPAPVRAWLELAIPQV